MPADKERTETFLLTTPLDMFEKLVWEHALMRDAYRRSQREQTYLAMNAAMTAWHLCDWLCAHCDIQHYKRLGAHWNEHVDNCTVFRRLVRKRPMLAMCEAIAVAGKHFTFERKTLQVSTRFEVLANSMEIPIVEDGTSSVSAPTMISIAIRFWADVLVESGLATEEEISGRVDRGGQAE